MKYLVNPIFKLLEFLLYILILYPFIYGVLALICLWEWNLLELRRFYHKPFGTGRKGNKRYVYRTIWDWFLNRKHYTDGGDTN